MFNSELLMLASPITLENPMNEHYSIMVDDKCGVIKDAEMSNSCTDGYYSKRPSGGYTNNAYQFDFISDTLILKGRVDEGYVGLKFLR